MVEPSTRTLIRNGIVLPLDDDKAVLDPGSVLIEGRDLVAVGPVDELDADPRSAGADVRTDRSGSDDGRGGTVRAPGALGCVPARGPTAVATAAAARRTRR